MLGRARPAYSFLRVLYGEGLVIGYGGDPVASKVDFSLSSGEILAVIGYNGSGKSTLVKSILGVTPLLGGRLRWDAGRPTTPVGYLGQLTDFDRRFPMRVIGLAATGGWSQLGFFEGAGRRARRNAEAALERVGLADAADMPLHKLSAGQLQRALFARTIMQDAQLIILDEPFAAVDQSTEADLMPLILDWSRQGRALILVMHNLSAVLEHCSSVLLMGRGGAAFGPTHEVLIPEQLVGLGYMAADKPYLNATAASTSAAKVGKYV